MRRPFVREDQPATELQLIVGASSERLDDIEGRAGGVIHAPKYDPSPSQADIHMTKAIVQIATPLGISVHDHIVGKNGHASLRGLKLIYRCLARRLRTARDCIFWSLPWSAIS
jgi:hypothetical protein